jgi:hypothetical protein
MYCSECGGNTFNGAGHYADCDVQGSGDERSESIPADRSGSGDSRQLGREMRDIGRDVVQVIDHTYACIMGDEPECNCPATTVGIIL